MNCIPPLINAAVLIYGGVIDFKRREIPNAVQVTFLMTGCFFAFSPLERILGLVAPAILLLAASKITGSEIPGGDFKLLCSLGFACGLQELAAVIFLTGIGAVVYGLIRHLPVKRHIPLCSYIAPSYITLQVIALVSKNC
ncbi:MAG: prepilin peptidase [Clostridia bacterium]|nr:prepilin peptidase [Clostridia bacterium]